MGTSDGPHMRDTGSRPYAVNAHYTAKADSQGILVRYISDGSRRQQRLKLGIRPRHHSTVLSFDPTRPNLLAVSLGAHLTIFDVNTATAKYVFRGHGRIITSISFARADSETIATGTADGTICIWSSKDTARPQHLLRGMLNACRHVAIHPHDASIIASVHGDEAVFWKLPNAMPVAYTNFHLAGLQMFSWCPLNAAQIIAVDRNGMINVCDVHGVIVGAAQSNGRPLGDSSDEKDLHVVNFDMMQRTISPTTFKLGSPIAQARILGQNGLVVLPRTSKDLYFHNYALEDGRMTELWRLHKDTCIDCFSFSDDGKSLEVVVISQTAVERYKVPGPVLDNMGWSRQLQNSPTISHASKMTSEKLELARSTRMRPQKIQRRKRASPDQRDSKAPRAGKRRVNGVDTRLKPLTSKKEPQSRPETPVPKSMTSSLELPKARADEADEDSPMPFLSPNIPARKTSPGLVTALDESLRLPPLALLHASAATDNAHESDSDDETFAGDMKGSGTLLPGSVNVPLPRTCGAVFGANGQLVTFLPYSVKPSFKEAHALSKSPTGADEHGEEINELFPGFGNLSTPAAHTSFSDTGSHTANDELTTNALKLEIQPSSFEGKPMRGLKISSTKPTVGPLLGERRVNVSVRNVEILTPMRHALANTYSLCSGDGGSDSDLCYRNARLATEEGLSMSARAWRSLAMILEPSTPKSVGLEGLRDILALVLASQDELPAEGPVPAEPADLTSRIAAKTHPLLHLPLGRGWAAERLFAWAEERADIQLLACMSTLLARTSDKLKTDNGPRRSRSATMLQANLVHSATQGSTISRTSVPTLYTDDAMAQALARSPNKSYQSRLSSGNPSQPTTPYLDSSNSTPPFAFSSNSRQTSKYSGSGSASPEHQRSSFGAAAKNYAASIAEKFSSYGSSPPSRKFGTSPGNELSSSLPTASGSWSKSVSFASTTESAQTSKPNLSLAQEDDGYDSDRTVEDNNMAQTPRKLTTGVSVTPKNGAFFGEKSSSQRPLQHQFPQHLILKGTIWRRQYAEHLRAWDMLGEAAEMANVATSSTESMATTMPTQNDVVPHAASGRHNTCTICYCIVRAAEQICPVCLHTTHPRCLDDFLAALGPQPFTCPAGCGCDCASAADVTFTFESPAVEPAAPREPKLAFRKKPSLTDPLRLRQRLQGESW